MQKRSNNEKRYITIIGHPCGWVHHTVNNKVLREYNNTYLRKDCLYDEHE